MSRVFAIVLAFSALLVALSSEAQAGDVYDAADRSQVFIDHNSVEKDTAFAVSGGLGMEFVLKPRKTSLGIEGRVHQLFFSDRYSQEYLPSGIQDLTGPMYSMITSLVFFF